MSRQPGVILTLDQSESLKLIIFLLTASNFKRAAGQITTALHMNVSEEESFTAGGDVGEALVLASFPLAVADVEVDVDRSGESLVPVGRDLDEEGVL